MITIGSQTRFRNSRARGVVALKAPGNTTLSPAHKSKSTPLRARTSPLAEGYTVVSPCAR
jgi:hypothetical protein